MKLSDIKGDRVIDVIADLIEPVANIAADKSITLFKREVPPDGMSAHDFAAMKIRKGAPVLLKTHKDDVVSILATIKGQTPAEYAENLNMASFVLDAIELLSDSAFVDLFTSAARTDESSGSASGNTEGRKN